MNARSGFLSKTLVYAVLFAILMIGLAHLPVQTASAQDMNRGRRPTKTPWRTPTPTKTPGTSHTPTPTGTATCEGAFAFTGTVYDASTGQGIPGAIVGGAFPAAYTGGPYGMYTIHVPEGWGCYITGIAVRADGYEPYFLPYNVNYLIYYASAPPIWMQPVDYTPTPTATEYATETPGPFDTPTPPAPDTPTASATP